MHFCRDWQRGQNGEDLGMPLAHSQQPILNQVHSKSQKEYFCIVQVLSFICKLLLYENNDYTSENNFQREPFVNKFSTNLSAALT